MPKLPTTISEDGPRPSGNVFVEPYQPRYQIWGSSEYLLWWVKSNPLSTPLVTTTNNPNLFDASGANVAAGVGRPGTSVLLGGNDITYNAMSGAKFALGMWLDSENTVGVEGRGFFLGQSSFQRGFGSDTNGNPVVGIPVNNPFPINTPLLTVISVGENAVTESLFL